jgi:hypothetical protein
MKSNAPPIAERPKPRFANINLNAATAKPAAPAVRTTTGIVFIYIY